MYARQPYDYPRGLGQAGVIGSVISDLTGLFTAGSKEDNARKQTAQQLYNCVAQYGDVTSARAILNMATLGTSNTKPIYQPVWNQVLANYPDIANQAQAAGPLLGAPSDTFPGCTKPTGLAALLSPSGASGGGLAASLPLLLVAGLLGAMLFGPKRRAEG